MSDGIVSVLGPVECPLVEVKRETQCGSSFAPHN
jgi:hypothetical protein